MELHIFDFDGTLFKSPDEPSWWPKSTNGSWWVHHDSLARPCVPDHPDDSWWVGSIVSAAKKSIAAPGVLAIMCTGRPDNKGGYRWRIPELLKQKGLNFAGVHLNQSSSVRVHKAAVASAYLKKHPDITTVEMWDDRAVNLQAVRDVTEYTGRVFIGHLVQEQNKKPACTEESYMAGDAYEQDPAVRLARRWLESKQ